MNRSLVKLTTLSDFSLTKIFEEGFQNCKGWLSYLDERLGVGDQCVSNLLNRLSAAYGAAPDFQALYVACWIHTPVEKGSYMIPLMLNQAQVVEAAVGRLPWRWSSHLGGMGRSAGQGYQFLKGYSELLVQLELDRGSSRPWLFLKSEGHSAISFAHISSYFTKLRTGEGDTQSAELHELALRGYLGIEPRAAENYSNAYQALLKNVRLSGKQVTAKDAIPAICEKLERKTTLANGKTTLANAHLWQDWKRQRQENPDLATGNVNLANLVEQVILPTIRQQLIMGKHLRALLGAQADLERLAKVLRRDAAFLAPEFPENLEAQVPRFFEEVRVTPRELDVSLSDFRKQLEQQLELYATGRNWRA